MGEVLGAMRELYDDYDRFVSRGIMKMNLHGWGLNSGSGETRNTSTQMFGDEGHTIPRLSEQVRLTGVPPNPLKDTTISD